MKRVVNVLGGIILAALIGLSVTACDNPAGTDAPPQVDLSGLAAAISDAETLLDATVVSADGSDVQPAVFWATQAAHTIFADAVATAISVRGNTASTQAQVDTAHDELVAAYNAFSAAARRADVDLDSLAAAISSAQALLAATAESAADGFDVQHDAYWATPAARNAFYNAIATATGVRGNAVSTQAQIDAARNALVAAHDAFGAARDRAQVDLSGLTAAISSAQALLAATVVSANGSGVPLGDFWAAQAAHTIFADAIVTAAGVRGNTASTQAYVDAARDALVAAQWSSPDFLDSELSR